MKSQKLRQKRMQPTLSKQLTAMTSFKPALKSRSLRLWCKFLKHLPSLSLEPIMLVNWSPSKWHFIRCSNYSKVDLSSKTQKRCKCSNKTSITSSQLSTSMVSHLSKMTTRRLKITNKSFKRERMLETHLSLQRLDAQRRSRASI